MASINQIKQIVDKLPIGYYAGRKINVELSEDSSTSYYTPTLDTITIATKNFELANDEQMIRTIFYHEVSHAILTPKTLTPNDAINIFEDERIETIFAHYYMHTNFKRTLHILNDANKEPASATEYFFDIVRFRKGPKHLVDKVATLINDFKTINRNADYWGMTYYKNCVMDFYKECSEEFLEHKLEEQARHSESIEDDDGTEQTTSKDETETDTASDEGTEQSDETSAENADENTEASESDTGSEEPEQSDDSSMKPDAGTQQDGQSDNDDYDEDETEGSYDETFAKSTFQSVIDTANDKSTDDAIFRILDQTKKVNAQFGSAVNAYSGRLDPRSAGRKDCKFFVRQNNTGSNKGTSKQHLTLWLDRSGSYMHNVDATNNIIGSLVRYEAANPDFELDIVTMGMGQTILGKKDRILSANGGNLLDNEIFEQVRQMQKPGCRNYNIVLFDGDAFSDSYNVKDCENFGAFNSANFTVITERSNKRYCKHCPRATVVISTNYVKDLKNEVLKALTQMTR